MPSTITKNRSPATLITPASVRKYSGRRVSPTARKTAAPKLYSMVAGMPIKYTRIYSTAWSSTSAGVAIHTSMGRASSRPAAISTNPPNTAVISAVCTVCCASSKSFAPRNRATSTFAPTDMPIKKLTSRLISELVEPTAAIALLLTKRPTTMISVALNSSCSTPEQISGTANSRIRLSNGPWHMSISYDFLISLSSFPSLSILLRCAG